MQDMLRINVSRMLIVLATVMAVFILIEFTGCGNVREGVIFNPETGEHISDWIDKHGGFFIEKPKTCTECHGERFDGGIAKLGCYSNSFDGVACHGVRHPDGWETDHAPTASSNNAGCGTTICHGTDFTGGVAFIGCFDCHLGGPNPSPYIMHPSLWQDPEESHKEYLDKLDKDASRCSPSRQGIAQYCHGAGLPDDPDMLSAPPNNSWPKAKTCYECHDKKWKNP